MDLKVTKKSSIAVTLNHLRSQSVHAEAELWGTIGNNQRPHILVFNPNEDAIQLSYITDTSKTTLITKEEFSEIVWDVKMDVEEKLTLSKENEDKIREQIVKTAKMVVTVVGLEGID